MERFDRIVERIMGILTNIGFVCLMLMMLVAVANVILRPLGHSILSTYEMAQLLICVTISFALGNATLKLSHPNMDMLISKFSQRTRQKLAILSFVLGLCLWVPISWYSFEYAHEQMIIGETTVIAKFAIYPFRYLFAFGAFLTCLLMVYNIIKIVKAIKEGKTSA